VVRKAMSLLAGLALMCGVVSSAGSAVAAEPVLAPAATVTGFAPTVLGLGVTTDIVVTGTGFIAGTVFASNDPTLVINNATVDSSTQITINVTAPPTPKAPVVSANPPSGQGSPFFLQLFVRGSDGTFFPITPVRAADTRLEAGGSGVPIGPHQTRSFTVLGVGEVPVANVTAVALNVTVTEPDTASFVTVYPAGQQLPVVSNLNFVAGQTIPNQVTVGVGAGGQITVYNDAGFTDVIVDIVGYYVNAAGPAGAGYAPSSGHTRVFDTRTGLPLRPGETFNFQERNAAALGVTAAVYNVTVDQATADGYLTTYPTGSPRPTASSVNFVAGKPAPNLVTVKVGVNDSVSFYNGSPGTVHLIIDSVGVYTTSPNGWSYVVRPVPGGPFRLWDSRVNLGRPVQARETIRVSGAALPATTTDGVIANATVTGPSNGGYAVVFPSSALKPQTSSLNFTAAETRANQVIPAPLMSIGRDISIYNDADAAHFIIDVFAYLQGY
jgi:hypothetical protein